MVKRVLLLIGIAVVLLAIAGLALQFGLNQQNGEATSRAYLTRMEACKVYTDQQQYKTCLDGLLTPSP